jgi:hypothetical protein
MGFIMDAYNGGLGFSDLGRFGDIESRSISAENFDGAKGAGGMAVEGFGAAAARDLGQGWKVSPAVEIGDGETFEIADIAGPGVIRHMWMTAKGSYRFFILRIYWEGSDVPSVECPLGDFFANGNGGSGEGRSVQVDSQAVCVNTRNAMNCYWPMAFRKKCRITLENISGAKTLFFYQVDYTLNEVPENVGYFHAQFRRSNPLPYKTDYTILNRIEGRGQYVGTYMLWGSNNSEWWGEGEIKMYLDGDDKWPTICGTGTEDYFCGAWCFAVKDAAGKNVYREYSNLYAGFFKANDIDDYTQTQKRFAMYRWHIADPVFFKKDLRITMQALGWRIQDQPRKYLPLQEDIASVAYWYQDKPNTRREPLPHRDFLEII